MYELHVINDVEAEIVTYVDENDPETVGVENEIFTAGTVLDVDLVDEWVDWTYTVQFGDGSLLCIRNDDENYELHELN
jgi:hypothetical protein